VDRLTCHEQQQGANDEKDKRFIHRRVLNQFGHKKAHKAPKEEVFCAFVTHFLGVFC
jgi:hypothetical protein